MNTTSRLDNPASLQSLVANKTLISAVLVAGITSAVVISIATAGYIAVPSPIRATDSITAMRQTTPQTATVTVNPTNIARQTIQVQQPNNLVRLQPAPNTVQNSGATVNLLQPTTNSIQLTGNNLQNAQAVIQ